MRVPQGHVETRIFAVLPDHTWAYPGHGDDTTIGAERAHLGAMARARLVTAAALMAETKASG